MNPIFGYDHTVNDCVALNYMVTPEGSSLSPALMPIIRDDLPSDAVAIDCFLPPIQHFPKQTIGTNNVGADNRELERLPRLQQLTLLENLAEREGFEPKWYISDLTQNY